MARGIVGRDSERERVATFVAGAQDGFATLILEGPAGIGKTTLWRDARPGAGSRGEGPVLPRLDRWDRHLVRRAGRSARPSR